MLSASMPLSDLIFQDAEVEAAVTVLRRSNAVLG